MPHHPQSIASTADVAQFEQQSPYPAALPAQSVYGVLQHSAERFGTRGALALLLTGEADEQIRRIDYRALFDGVTRAANLFASLAGQGAGVAYLLPSLIETHFVLWGAEASGYAVPLNPLMLDEQVADLVRASGAKVLVCVGSALNAQIWDKAVHVKRSLPQLELVCIGVPEQADVDCIDFSSAMQRQRGDQLTFAPDLSPDAVVAYFHTGGTTGTPKLVAHTNRNQVCAAFGAGVLLGLGPEDRVCNGLPMFHVAGAIASSLAHFMCGGEVLILSPLGLRNPLMIRQFWHIAEHHGVTIVGAVPTALAAILSVPLTSALTRVRFGITGSAPIPASVVARFRSVTGKGLHEILGMTESGGVTAIDPAGGMPTPGSVGVPLPYTRLRVRRIEADGSLGENCAPDEIGVLFVTGPNVSPGYRDPAHNAGVFIEGGLNTGDLAYLSTDGKLFISGRAKDLIIRSGHNIDPQMVEAAFSRLPGVALAAVVGQPDTYAGELPVAYVTLAPGATADAAALCDAVREFVAERPAWPKSVYILDTMPLTSVGKIFKPQLRCDAIVRLLRPVLEGIAGPAVTDISACDGGKRGFEVTVALNGCDDATAGRVREELGRYVFHSSLRREKY